MSKIKIPKRKNNTNKGHYGRVLIIAGSSGMIGAGILASRAALRSGAGLVYLAVPKDLVNIANLATPEVIVKSHEEIKNIQADVVAIGPGLGQSNIIYKILCSFVISNLKLVIDADALNMIAKKPEMLQKLPKNSILTPHPGEMARLTGLSVEEIQKNRIEVAKEYSKKWNVKIVLKGYKTVIAYPNGKIYLNKTGNPGMATAGAGDVLTGIIAAFKAQDLCVCDAVHVHGLAGDLAKKEKGEYGLVASDIIGQLPKAIVKCIK